MSSVFSSPGSDNSAAAAAQAAQEQQALQQQQWQQEQVQAQQTQQSQSAQAQALQAKAEADAKSLAQQQQQAQLKAAQEKAAEAAATPYQSSSNATGLQPINAATSLLAGASTGDAGIPGFNQVMAKSKTPNQGFAGQQNSLSSSGVKLGGS